ncbi:MAG: DegV family protein [Actinomycetota bacterium]|nr:DegV family protein [Actinomycetota bacterium]
MIGICTDSNSQLPDLLAERYAIEVVPITVTVDDHDYLEGVDLDADRFYDMLSAEPPPTISTSQPSPGQFAAAYESLLHRGCDEILSIHVTASTSGTLNSARLATRSLPVPVRLVDSGTASFGVSCCVWAAAEAVANGATLDEAVQVAETLAPRIGTVFVVGALDFIRSGGRGPELDANAREVANERADEGAGIPVLTMHAGEFKVVSHVRTRVDAVNAMASMAIGWGSRSRVAVGLADRSAEPLTQALEAAVRESPNVVEVVRYRIGPSVGVYTGPGTVGCFMFPAD